MPRMLHLFLSKKITPLLCSRQAVQVGRIYMTLDTLLYNLLLFLLRFAPLCNREQVSNTKVGEVSHKTLVPNLKDRRIQQSQLADLPQFVDYWSTGLLELT